MKRPGVGVAIILRRKINGEHLVLLGKRKNALGAGTWAFPGGRLELKEDFKSCAIRELKEETDLIEGKNFKIINEFPVVVTNDIFEKENKHYITLFIRADYLSGSPIIKELDRCGGWAWFYWNQLPSNLFLPIKNLIKQGYSPFET